MHTHLILIADRSGSMQGKETEVIGGINRFLEEQRAAPGTAVISIVQFDDQFEPQPTVNVKDAPNWKAGDYVPRGMTALLDAVGRTMDSVGREVYNSATKVDKVIACIVTDGAENASREYTNQRVASMIKHAEANGWHFLFLGADASSWGTAMQLGINAANFAATVPTARGQGASYVSASATATMLRSGVASANLQATYDASLQQDAGQKQ
jgi:uncharacterized protein YegL